MSTIIENNEEESFIILGTSPGTSLDIQCKGIESRAALDKAQIEDAMKDLSMEDDAYKAHFNLADCPSPASMMVASNIITEDKSTEELQKKFGELLDENAILKDTLKQNNDSIKEQFMVIASCQDDMLRTTMLHNDKFEETKAFVENLRQQNKKLQQELAQLAAAASPVVNGETGEAKSDPDATAKSGPSSALEFVTSPEDDTVDKLTAQLELVEKQRRQVITDNEKLTWQKESLEHIVDATTKERDDLKEKLKHVELQLSSKITDHETQLRELNFTIADLQNKLTVMSISPEEITKRDIVINQLNDKANSLLAELKSAKLEILKSEDLKIDLAQHKLTTQEMMKAQKENLQEMNNRLKEATTTVFQPVRLSVSPEPNASEFGSFGSNVKLYDRTLKHLSDLLNKLTHGLSDSLMETLGLVLNLFEYRLERESEAQFKRALALLKDQLERQQCDAMTNVGQVRGTLTIFEGIFKDYKEIVKKIAQEKPMGNIEALTAALVARGQELQILQGELNKVQSNKEDIELMTAQLDLYRSDFEAERQAREKMASEKDSLQTDLRQAQKRIQELTQQLEEVRRLNPGLYRSATSKPRPAAPPAPPAPAAPHAPATPASTIPPTNRNMVYKCPKCMRFTCDQMRVMEDHLDFCLDDF